MHISGRRFSLLAAAALAALLIACSSGPQPPAKGTPAFYWSAAQETFGAGDYQKTLDHLLQINKSENEFTGRARPWTLLIASGMARGYRELADQYEQGSRANKQNPAPFRKQASDLRSLSTQLSLQFAETVEKFESAPPTPEVLLDFPVPQGSANQPPATERIASGMLPGAGESETVLRQVIQRAVLIETARAAGAPDTAKIAEILKTRPAKVPRETFFLAVAQSLYDQSQLFGPSKLDSPDRMAYFLKHASDIVTALKADKPVKDLADKIQAAMKKKKT